MVVEVLEYPYVLRHSLCWISVKGAVFVDSVVFAHNSVLQDSVWGNVMYSSVSEMIVYGLPLVFIVTH